MTNHDLMAKLRRAGFTASLLWKAREPGTNRETVRCYTIRGADGQILTSAVTREIPATADRPALTFVFWLSDDHHADPLRTLRAKCAEAGAIPVPG